MRQNVVLCFAMLLVLFSTAFCQPASWGGYTIHEQYALGSLPGATYYRLTTNNGSAAHVVSVDMRSGNWEVKPVYLQPMLTTTTSAQRLNATAAINGGFFAFGSGASVGYIMTDGKIMTDPNNSSVVKGNSNLAGYVGNVLNRSEVRFLTGPSGNTIQIVSRNAPLPAGATVRHVLQAGPQLLPRLTSREEAFIRGSVDAIGCNGSAQRTAIGITTDSRLLLVCVDGRKRSSPGLSLKALAEFLRDLGCTQALNFDGGGSTTMFVRPAGATAGKTVCGTQRRVASALLLLERSTANAREKLRTSEATSAHVRKDSASAYVREDFDPQPEATGEAPVRRDSARLPTPPFRSPTATRLLQLLRTRR